MNPQFSQPGGSVGKEVNKETIARIFGLKRSDVSDLKTGSPIDGYKILFDRVTQLCWYRGSASGNPVSWSISGSDLNLVTSNGTFLLKMALSADYLRSKDGASNIGIGKSTVDLTRQPTIFEYLSTEDQTALLTDVSSRINIDQALKDAISDGVMNLRLPWVLGRYVAGSSMATLPIGFELWANSCRRPYTAPNDAAFNGTGVTIQVAAGAVAPFISTQRHVFRGINFDGVNKTPTLFYSTNSGAQFNGSRVEHCGIYRMAVALGWSGYIGTLFAYRNSISGNATGVRNTIDSNIHHNVMNANDRHISLLTGANNSDFTGNRLEWSNSHGVYIFDAVRNVITGELLDRSGGAGIVVAGVGSLTVNGTVIQRNGATTAVNDNYSSHIVLLDNGKIILNGVRTTTGVNDDGTGTASPSFCVSYIGSGTPQIIASGCDFSGYLTSAENNKNNPEAIITGCKGISDVVTIGGTKKIRSRNVIDLKEATLAAGAGSTLTFNLSIPVDERAGPIQYGAYLRRTLVVECRLSTTTTPDELTIPIWFRYETSWSILNRLSKLDVTSPRIGMDNTATGVMVNWSLNSTGDTLTVTLTNVDGIDRKSRVTLLPI